jgi:hypothetical protein
MRGLNTALRGIFRSSLIPSTPGSGLRAIFRHEWKLAMERKHHMAQQKSSLRLIAVDGTRDQEILSPDGT